MQHSDQHESSDKVSGLITDAYPIARQFADDLAFAGVFHSSNLHDMRGRAIIHPAPTPTATTPAIKPSTATSRRASASEASAASAAAKRHGELCHCRNREMRQVRERNC